MAVTSLLTERAPRSRLDRIEASIEDGDPYGIDIQLTLHTCYELHYRGFAGVDTGWEWNPGLLHLRARLEDTFLTALRRDARDTDASARAGEDLTRYLHTEATWQQMREFFVHRSLYRLRGEEPNAWAVPARDSTAGVSFSDVLLAADLDPEYLAYADVVPAEALAVVNLRSLFGLHRGHRVAAVGYLAATEHTASAQAGRIADALERMKAPQPCTAFYREQMSTPTMPVPEPAAGFGMRAHRVVEGRLAAHLLDRWRAGKSSLRRPLS